MSRAFLAEDDGYPTSYECKPGHSVQLPWRNGRDQRKGGSKRLLLWKLQGASRSDPGFGGDLGSQMLMRQSI